jgi:PKD repeat protein
VLGVPFTFSLGNDTTFCGAGPFNIEPNVGLFFNGDSLTIRYDATKGLGDLENAAKVYIHSGIAVSANGPWTYVAGNWGQDDGWGEMTEVSQDIWEITINPTSHYNLPPAISYAGIWMVFRNADGTVTGKNDAGQDIYLNTSVTPAFTSTFDGIEADFTPGPFQSIVWSTGETSQSISVTASGTYSATISNGTCTATDEITVNFLAAPTLTVSNDTSFCGAIQNLPIAASAGFDNYLWSNGATTAAILVNAAGVYEVTASMNNGCSFTDSVAVRNNVLASSVALGPDRTICGTQVLEIGPTVSVTSAGDSITVIYDATKGVGDLEGANKVYFHSTYELVPFGGPVAPWVGNWGLDDGIGEMTEIENDIWSITFNPYAYYDLPLGTNLNGLFMVFRNANGTLTGKDDNNNDIFLNLSVNPPTSAFDGVTATADISPFEGILWSNGETTQTIAVNTPGTYSMIVFGAEGCNVYDTIQVNSSPSPFVNLGPNRFICPGTEFITLNAGAGFSSYTWSTDDTTQTLNVSDAGVYVITVTNAAGCEGTDQLTVTVPGAANAQFTAVEGNGFQVTFTNTSTGTDTYAWDFDGNGTTDNSSANATVNFTYPTVGTYTARLIATGLCGTDTFTLLISVIGVSTGEEITESSWAIYPNPSNELLNMSLPQVLVGISEIEIYNELGALVRKVITSDKMQVINVSEFTSGIYFVRIANGNTFYNKRFIKQ